MHEYDARIVRGAAAATMLTALPAVVIAWLLAGTRGAVGCGLGFAVAAAFFSVTVVVVSWAGRVAPHLMLPAALATYALKFALLLVAAFALRDTAAFDRKAFALAVVAGTCAYLVAELRMAMRVRIPYVVTDGEGD